eukprot:scaffold24208_cov75-Phaeocystis_antarctica.AAC.1
MAGACTMLLRVMVARVWGYRLGPPAPRSASAVQGRPLRVRASGLDRGHVVNPGPSPGPGMGVAPRGDMTKKDPC